MSWLVEGKWGTEKEDHVRLKDVAVMFLLSEGFDRGDIYEEKRVYGSPIDIVGEQDDGSLVMVECETNTSSSPPPFRQVSYDTHLYEKGHQLFALTLDGLFELVDQNGGHFVRCDSIQTTLQSEDERTTGRWFANSTSIQDIPEVSDFCKWSYVTEPKTYHYSSEHLKDDYNRWNANGIEKSERQPDYKDISNF